MFPVRMRLTWKSSRNFEYFELTDNDKKLGDEEQTHHAVLVISFLPVSIFSGKIFEVNIVSKNQKVSIRKEDAICDGGEVLKVIVDISHDLTIDK